MKKQDNSISSFIDDIAYLPCSVLFGKYVYWCHNNKFVPMNESRFQKETSRLFGNSEILKREGRRIRVWKILQKTKVCYK